MSHLADTLRLRRTAMKTPEEKVGMMDRVSDMIPLPPTPEGGSGVGVTGNEEWED